MLNFVKLNYLLINFGLNDAKVKKFNSENLPEKFAKNIECIVNLSLQNHVEPILVTPLVRRKFVNKLISTDMDIYRSIVIKIAKKYNLCCIDLFSYSKNTYEILG